MEELRRRHDEFAYDALIEALAYIIMLDMAKKPDEEMFANGHSAKPVPVQDFAATLMQKQ